MTLHRDVLAAAIMRATDASAFAAEIEADAILDELARYGWRLTDVADRVEQARARRTDPDTSRAAADSVDDLNDRQSAVLFALYELGESTDAEIAARYPGLVERFPDVYPPQSPASLRTRRSELVPRYVVDTGEVGLSDYGRPSIIWAASDARVSAVPR